MSCYCNAGTDSTFGTAVITYLIPHHHLQHGTSYSMTRTTMPSYTLIFYAKLYACVQKSPCVCFSFSLVLEGGEWTLDFRLYCLCFGTFRRSLHAKPAPHSRPHSPTPLIAITQPTENLSRPTRGYFLSTPPNSLPSSLPTRISDSYSPSENNNHPGGGQPGNGAVVLKNGVTLLPVVGVNNPAGPAAFHALLADAAQQSVAPSSTPWGDVTPWGARASP